MTRETYTVNMGETGYVAGGVTAESYHLNSKDITNNSSYTNVSSPKLNVDIQKNSIGKIHFTEVGDSTYEKADEGIARSKDGAGPTGAEALQKMAEQWLEHPERSVKIVGNASVEGSRDANIGLAIDRAESAKKGFLDAVESINPSMRAAAEAKTSTNGIEVGDKYGGGEVNSDNRSAQMYLAAGSKDPLVLATHHVNEINVSESKSPINFGAITGVIPEGNGKTKETGHTDVVFKEFEGTDNVQIINVHTDDQYTANNKFTFSAMDTDRDTSFHYDSDNHRVAVVDDGKIIGVIQYSSDIDVTKLDGFGTIDGEGNGQYVGAIKAAADMVVAMDGVDGQLNDYQIDMKIVEKHEVLSNSSLYALQDVDSGFRQENRRETGSSALTEENGAALYALLHKDLDAIKEVLVAAGVGGEAPSGVEGAATNITLSADKSAELSASASFVKE